MVGSAVLVIVNDGAAVTHTVALSIRPLSRVAVSMTGNWPVEQPPVPPPAVKLAGMLAVMVKIWLLLGAIVEVVQSRVVGVLVLGMQFPPAGVVGLTKVTLVTRLSLASVNVVDPATEPV